MQILSISLKNLASLPEATLDFKKEPLKSAGIYAITGATGAGKSTILDALCLALYAESPRYKQAGSTDGEMEDKKGKKIKQDDVRGILRDGTGDGWAEVKFIGADNDHYRAKWTVRRARNKSEESLQPDEMEFHNDTLNINLTEKKTETKKKIEQKVGLNYEQFTRSVLLAQGDFSAFLKAKNDDRASLLEKLTGTGIYSDISRLVYRKTDDAKKEVDHLDRQIKEYIVYTDEELQILHQQVGTLNIEKQQLETQVTNIANEITWTHTAARLQHEKQAAEQQLLQTTAAKVNAAGRAEKLQHISNAQEMQSIVNSKNETQTQSRKLTLELENIVIQINNSNHEIALLAQKLKEAQESITNTQQVLENARPAMDRAREVDTLLQEKNKQLVQAKEQAKVAADKLLVCRKATDKKNIELAQASKQQQELDKWRHDNAGRQPIADNIDIILSKLVDAGKYLDLQKKAEGEIANQNKERDKTEKAIEVLNIEVSNQQKALNSKAESIAAVEANLAEKDIDSAKSNEANMQNTLMEVTAAKGLWALLHDAMVRNRQLTDKQQLNEQALVRLNKEIQEKQAELQNAKVQKETSDTMLTRAQIAATKDVKKLREQLTDGEPCPVCGSDSHPYAHSNQPVNDILDTLKKENTDYTNAYERLMSAYSTMQEQCKTVEKEITNGNMELEVVSTKRKDYAARWEAMKIEKESTGIPDDTLADWLNDKEQAVRHELKNVQHSIATYTFARQDLEKQKTTYHELEKSCTNNINRRGIEAVNFTNSLSIIANLEKQKAEYVLQLNAIIALLEPYFNRHGWTENWQQNSQKFISDIENFATAWKAKIQELEQLSNTLKVLTAESGALSAQLTTAEAELKDKENMLKVVQTGFTELSHERQTIFNGVAIATVEQQLKEEVTKAQAHEKQVSDARLGVTNKLITQTTQQQQLNTQLAEQKSKIAELEERIDGWMTGYRQKHDIILSMEILSEWLSCTYEWIQQEQKALRDLDNELIAATAAYQERELQYERHEKLRTTNQTLEELLTIQETYKAEQNTKTKSISELEYRLREDAANKSKIRMLESKLKEKKAIYENWYLLNDLIGSADGKKFKMIAQQYTLDVLLALANIHLKDLTTRYTLQRIPNSLSMQVVDSDMGDEVRTVYSLSGGETFLVSLALALGLASLSSDLMTIESLFIDEGFGALDPTTLSIAMEALERLQNKGRKVGIITHVAEMTERISVQVKVNKQTNGKSRVEIVG